MYYLYERQSKIKIVKRTVISIQVNKLFVLEELLFSMHSHWNPDKKNHNHFIAKATVAIDNEDIFHLKGVTLKRLFKQDQLVANKLIVERTEAELTEKFNSSSYFIEIDSFKVSLRSAWYVGFIFTYIFV